MKTSRRSITLPPDEYVIELHIDDCRMWRRASSGNIRAEKWSKAVKQAERMIKRGIEYKIIWHSAADRKSEYGDGVVEVTTA